jgi:hypothetical protein
MKSIRLFFVNIRREFFFWRIEHEICDRIFPHLEGEWDYGYPFNSDDELQKICEDSAITSLPFVQSIERDIVRMPKAYGEAFRYILYRDLTKCLAMPQKRMAMYQMVAKRNIYPETCDPRFVATCA